MESIKVRIEGKKPIKIKIENYDEENRILELYIDREMADVTEDKIDYIIFEIGMMMRLSFLKDSDIK